jgi:hypothetical protein
VPSAVIERSANYLLNPAHPDFTAIRIGDPVAFDLDRRLLKEGAPGLKTGGSKRTTS